MSRSARSAVTAPAPYPWFPETKSGASPRRIVDAVKQAGAVLGTGIHTSTSPDPGA